MAIDLRLLVLSDLHGDHSIIGKICEKTSNERLDALVFCGDLTHFGNITQAEEILKELTGLGIPLLFVPGNCDPKELATVQSFNGATNIHGRCKEVEGLGFLGIGGSPPGPFNTPFEVSENEMGRVLEEAYRSSNMRCGFVLVSHSPPLNTKVDLTSFGVHAGSLAVREFIETKEPALVLCGHIHEARGTDIIDGVLIVNPGPARRGSYATVNVDGDIKVELGASR